MSQESRFVAVVTNDGSTDTYVFHGAVTLDDVFKQINERRVMYKVSGFSIHRDEMLNPPFHSRKDPFVRQQESSAEAEG
ncbi:hypothetical protein [Ancylobacter defluvii]|uniref:Uncharacterized protein n=1 Tax=Ancylobacter defluvii TaxID=1282440 RepID=A0A9W6JY23_9HYPH|nr:hypothetical protein [Ancylobacter defluvii]MBS7589057.1 hypothetical protein [Ancylobacter defluvii]GLK84666.1 hypothetical protein GCM10017653_27360 [Ancylobacter defluvii]